MKVLNAVVGGCRDSLPAAPWNVRRQLVQGIDRWKNGGRRFDLSGVPYAISLQQQGVLILILIVVVVEAVDVEDVRIAIMGSINGWVVHAQEFVEMPALDVVSSYGTDASDHIAHTLVNK